jgi:hypothetical protein
LRCCAIRDGVDMTMSGDVASSARCAGSDICGVRFTLRMSFAQKAAKVEIDFVTWLASSFVGTSMMAVVLGVEFVFDRRLRMDWRMGRTYAAVLPEPVFARAGIYC